MRDWRGVATQQTTDDQSTGRRSAADDSVDVTLLAAESGGFNLTIIDGWIYDTTGELSLGLIAGRSRVLCVVLCHANALDLLLCCGVQDTQV